MASRRVEKLTIRNMVCDRCIRVVREELEALSLAPRAVTLGEAEVEGRLTKEKRSAVREALVRNGFDLIEDRNALLIEAVKTAVIRLVHHDHEAKPLTVRLSDYIARAVGVNYHTLSVLFSSVENVTIEQYVIRQKIERVKELIRYEERTLSEIAYAMNYSSVQHLSNQFKSVTGLTPTEFRNLAPSHAHHRRVPIDKVK